MIHESRGATWSGHGSTNPLLYKTELCTSFQISGYCPYGSRCKFAHGSSELRPVPANYSSSSASGRPRSALYKTELCKSFAKNGHCSYHDRCQYAHGEEELRSVIRHPKYRTQLCRSFKISGSCRYGARCRFLHTREESAKVNHGPWGPAPAAAASLFGSSASTPDDPAIDTKTAEDGRSGVGGVGEAKSAGTRGKHPPEREHRHEQALLSFLGISAAVEAAPRPPAPSLQASSQRAWSSFATTPGRSQMPLAQPPAIPPPEAGARPQQELINNDATFSGLFSSSVSWKSF